MRDIWKVLNPHKKLSILRQKQFIGNMFESNSLQENPKILNSLLSNHFPITCSVVNNDASFRGLGVCKFNNSLQFNKQFVKKLKIHTVTINLNLQKQFSSSDHSK